MAISSYEKNGTKLWKVYVHTLDQTGKRLQKRQANITSEKAAKKIERELSIELDQRKGTVNSFSWIGWLEHCLTTQRVRWQKSTYINYKGRLAKWVTPIWQDRDIRSISATDVHELIFQCIDKTVSDYSRKNILKMVRTILELAVNEGLMNKNPTKGIMVKVPQKEMKVLTTSEAETLLDQAYMVDHDFKFIWAFALFTGMRSGELIALRSSDIDLEGKLVRVSKQWTKINGDCPTKTGKSRVVPISQNLERILLQLKVRALPPDAFILPRPHKWLSGNQSSVLKDFCSSIGITQVRFHDLRSTFITNLLNQGVALAKVMAIVGHDDIGTTQGYLRRAGVELKDATESLSYELPKMQLADVLELKRS